VLAFALVNLEHVERQLRERLDALGPAPRAELLHVLMLPDFDPSRPDRRVPGLPGESRRVFASRVALPDIAGPEGWS
jgi:hypothetical protein